MLELVHHHALEDVRLVVDVVEDVLPENIQERHRDQEPSDAHPKAVRKSGQGEGDDEVREDAGDEDHERLGSDKVEKEPHDPGEESAGCRLHVDQPVRYHREQQADEEQERQADEEVRD